MGNIVVCNEEFLNYAFSDNAMFVLTQFALVRPDEAKKWQMARKSIYLLRRRFNPIKFGFSAEL